MAAGKVPLIALLKTLYPERGEKELFAEILRGGVEVDGETVLKPGTPVEATAGVRVRDRPAYVSRGGEKLAAALDRWGISCAGTVWLDAGCSTGGFTDCLLKRGASLVHAVDVGENQLDWRLRSDPRVQVREGTNIMALGRETLSPAADSAVADLSFRSLRRAAAHVLGLTRSGWGIFLVKPQFEYREPPPDFNGVVKAPQELRSILCELVAALSEEGLFPEKAMPSPIRGRKGNREFLFLLRAGAPRTAGKPFALPDDLLLE
jgi:23S rRNA (cytidine1920-2'-O)/16S rRNA (cytidine1409-2'-O)-methyltransferase